MGGWYESPFTGLFSECGPLAPRPHDPAVAIYGGRVAPRRPGGQALTAGGAGWTPLEAEQAAVGEAIERLGARPVPWDRAVSACHDDWPLDEPAVPPERWVVFHRDQYDLGGFPFSPLTGATVCRWVAFRNVQTGEPAWVPEDFAYLGLARGHRIAPGLSTGLSCGRSGMPVALRGLQEAIERDAAAGAWWGAYPLEEHSDSRIFRELGTRVSERVRRPNLRVRFFRVRSPWSEHVTIVTLEGEDREGFVFSCGSACRSTRRESWTKALLEAVQGRHYVRYLLREKPPPESPRDFAGHAVWFSLHPDLLEATPFSAASPAGVDSGETSCETLATLCGRLGPERPALFRNMTHPAIATEMRDWVVLKVLVPGLQPLHGDHSLPLLGGPLWAPRRLRDWDSVLPHSFA